MKKDNQYKLPKNASSSELFFAEQMSNAEQPKEDKVRDKNQKYATKLPRNPSMFEMYAAEQMTKAKIKNKDKNFSF